MKTLILSIILIALPLVLLTSAACPECVENLDITDKKSVLTCVVTVVFGLVVRYIEKKRLDKKLKNKGKNEKY